MVKMILNVLELKKALSVVKKAAKSKSISEGMQSVLVECLADSIVLTSNNIEMGIEYIIEDVNVVNTGVVAINAAMFNNIVAELNDGDDIIIEVENNKAMIKSGKAKYEVSTIDPETFPKLPSINVSKTVSLPQETFKDLIKKTAFAVSNDENKKNLTGAFLEVKENSILLTGIDGYRLAHAESKTDSTNTDTYSVIIPKNSVLEIEKMLSVGDVKVQLAEKFIVFETENFKVMSLLIDMEYMNYQNLLASEPSTILTVNTQEMLNALNKVSLVTTEKTPLRVNVKGDIVKVSMTSSLGHAEDEVSVVKDSQKNNDIEIFVDVRYLKEVLKTTRDEEIKVSFVSPIAPVYLDEKDYQAKHLILPVRNQE